MPTGPDSTATGFSGAHPASVPCALCPRCTHGHRESRAAKCAARGSLGPPSAVPPCPFRQTGERVRRGERGAQTGQACQVCMNMQYSLT